MLLLNSLAAFANQVDNLLASQPQVHAPNIQGRPRRRLWMNHEHLAIAPTYANRPLATRLLQKGRKPLPRL
jgi:hypothetical protein